MVKAVIFDWDGTLADTRKAVVQSFQTVLTKTGCKVSNEFIERLMGVGTKKTIIEAFKKCNMRINVETLDNLSKEKVKIQAELADFVQVFDGAIELLDDLASKTKLAVATMSGRKVIDKVLAEKKIDSYFEAVISADDVNNPKPNPEIFLKTAKILGVLPIDCVVVEDSIFGVKAAKNANMKCIAVSSGVYSKNELLEENPDLLVDGIWEKDRILKFIFS
ncbi:MAG: HAD family phosphatase [Candidatus Bathyarchaeota archaeon]|nr:MAG: HAD family phosphatase [Candidatus Bathyarchaeota archaeon]